MTLFLCGDVMTGCAAPHAAEVLVLVGSFDEELAVICARPNARIICAVAAGMAAFGQALGSPTEGIAGPSQWEPAPVRNGSSGAFWSGSGPCPSTPLPAHMQRDWLCRNACGARAGCLTRRLRDVAVGLDFETFYGRFRIDADTGRQTGHRIVLVRRTAKVVVF